MKLHTRLFLLCTLAVVLILAAGCAAMPEIEVIEGADRDAVLALSEPAADTLFAGINEKDYAKFSTDFDEQMKKALTENSFNDLLKAMSKLGAYQSRTVEKVEKIDNIYTVSYKATFENEDNVSVRLSVRDMEPAQIAGIWFDSPKLREK